MSFNGNGTPASSYSSSSSSRPPNFRFNSDPHNTLSSDARARPTPSSLRSLVPPATAGRPSLSPTSPLDPHASTGSQERLLSPNTARSQRLRENNFPIAPNFQSEYSSRRTSYDSERSYGLANNPFSDSPPSLARNSVVDSDDGNVTTQTVAEKYNISPSAGLLLFPEDVEKDDYLHNPDPNGKEDRDCDVFTRRGMVNVGGLILITLGILLLFIGYPVLTFAERHIFKANPCKDDPDCINVGPVPLLKNVRQSLIDPNTPKSAMTKKDYDGKTLELVFSDEFSTPGRTFYDGDDPYFQAMDIWYGVTQDLEWYDPDAVTTKDGVLELRFDAFQSHNLNYRSGMLQSWNKICFKGGRIEASISLPGRGDTVGFWPGFWTMGNLGRAGYAATTEGLWPYSYHDECDPGITPNQSSSDGLSALPGMRLPACTCDGADHPTPGKSRSAPEIDALEASVHPLDAKGNMVGHVSQTFQLAPFDIWHQVQTEYTEIYDPTITSPNSYVGSALQQSISALVNLNNDWYNGKAYQLYAFEYTPGPQGQSTFFVGDEATYKITADAIGPNGNVGRRVFPQEPMYVIANFGMSPSFSPINFTAIADLLPATMRIDHIRIYQDPDEQSVTCDPSGYETTRYIARHRDVYNNPNLTIWADTDYEWPKNSLMDKC